VIGALRARLLGEQAAHEHDDADPQAAGLGLALRYMDPADLLLLWSAMLYHVVMVASSSACP
jgi:hypothetical protein